MSGCTVSAAVTNGSGVITTPAYAYECPQQSGTGPWPVDPVLVMTVYIPPVDAERPMRVSFKNGKEGLRDLLPAPSFGISLANITSDFYLGASNKAGIRNMQFFYGIAFHNIPVSLAPGPTQPIWGGGGT